MKKHITGLTVVALAHNHKCTPVVQPNGGYHIEGTDKRLRQLQKAIESTGLLYPSIYSRPSVNGVLVRGTKAYLGIHPQVAQRR